MDNSNLIYEIRNTATGIQGTTDYVVNLGSVLYNNRILTLSNLIIPLRGQSFFTLPEDKGKYAAVNVYYSVDTGSFIFDLVRKSDSFVQNVTSDALSSYLPIAQFIIQETYGSFKVLVVNQYSKMATFSITTTAEQGDRGTQGPTGDTGLSGYIGKFGETGVYGVQGETGPQGVTGVGVVGATGPQGDTGYYPDPERIFYGKFKSDSLTLMDYAVYERDLGWGASGAGYTGVGYTGVGLGDTGLMFVPQDPSSFVVEEGIVDNCHAITYNGGWSSYKNYKFIGFTGSIQAWVRLDVPPIADFTYTVDPLNTLRVTFSDASLLEPTVWEWDLGLGGGIIRAKNFTYLFSVHGLVIVTFRASNAAGVSERIKVITI